MKKTDSINKLSKAMKKVQDTERYEHTLGVAYTAASLAMCYNSSVKDALIAGMLHDCAKCLSDSKRLFECKNAGLSVSEIEMRNPSLLHAKVGAVLAERKYGIKDRDILNAIQYHTTGREDMSLLEKIIFVSDYIEPGRKQAPNLDEIRQVAFVNLDRAVLRILEDTLSYLREKEGEIDPATEVTLQYYRRVV